jgi:hypothetical protein
MKTTLDFWNFLKEIGMTNSSEESLLGRLFSIVLPMILQFQNGYGNKLWEVLF